MAKYRKKPVEIEAVQWTKEGREDVLAFLTQHNVKHELRPNDELYIGTLEDGAEAQVEHIASLGDWIIRGVAGECYPCKPAIFEQCYSLVTE